jgi:hypothetical protein
VHNGCLMYGPWRKRKRHYGDGFFDQVIVCGRLCRPNGLTGVTSGCGGERERGREAERQRGREAERQRVHIVSVYDLRSLLHSGT